MIPVLGIPILNSPDTLDRMLASIDHEVGEIVVVDNGNVVPPELEERVTVLRQKRNLGVAASWNTIFRGFDAPWWMISAFDVEYSPGDLDRLVARMDAGADAVLLRDFTSFAISRHALDTVGEFDENFHPAYYEDNDWDYRARLTGIRLEPLPSGMLHRNSTTIHSDPNAKTENDRTFPQNRAFYLKKWGGMPYREKFTTPFDEGGPPSEWTLDEKRVKKLAWRRVR